MKKLLMLFVLLAFTLVGCKDDDDSTGPSGNTEIMPLAIGNWWEYDEYEYDANTDEHSNLQGSYKIEIVGKTTFEGKEAYEIKETSGEEVENSYITVEGGNIYVGGAELEDLEGIVPSWIKLYDSEENSWVNYDIDTELDGTEFKIKNTANNEGTTSVSLNSKSYEAIKIRHTIEAETTFSIGGQTLIKKTTIVSNYLIIRGIGMYKITSNYNDADFTNTAEILVDYDVSN